MQPKLENCIITMSENQAEIYPLDLNISSIIFSHHSLFNYEHVIAAKLLDLYECFQKRQQQNVTQLLSEKVRIFLFSFSFSLKNSVELLKYLMIVYISGFSTFSPGFFLSLLGHWLQLLNRLTILYIFKDIRFFT